ncbi:Monoacylglycerol Lipase [Klebsormidium nitens]|uniref:Monoacylglycerol Lipase n=1 Tax=Klebsormidium nitens TaxID=105231 RepID=A0A1Y1HL20_KLENI|nr:Monoacylglycerol Lipase [Klebsormidium nitens]|eukprot:GAQ78332.1 Monoacylglycerol Lipase [Klebsormidium nitens]
MEGIEELFKERLVDTTEGHFTCSRGVKLFTRTWTPSKQKPKALVCILHGFGSNISWLAQKTALLFTDAGYAVAGLDAQGFGRSDGLDGYIPDFDHLVSDAREYFGTVRKLDRFQELPAFLYGESMGGASALLLSLDEPGEWAGAILSAPMVKILDKYRPPWIVEQLGLLLVHVIPTWPIVPVRNRVDNSFRDPAKCELAKKDPYIYVKKPRLKTGQELLRVTLHLQQRLQEITIPFLVLHGTADTVTDIEVSQALYEQAASSDKTIKIYPDGYHALLQGEPEEQRQRIADDIVTWIDKRAHAYTHAGGKAALQDAELVDRVLEDA